MNELGMMVCCLFHRNGHTVWLKVGECFNFSVLHLALTSTSLNMNQNADQVLSWLMLLGMNKHKSHSRAPKSNVNHFYKSGAYYISNGRKNIILMPTALEWDSQAHRVVMVRCSHTFGHIFPHWECCMSTRQCLND